MASGQDADDNSTAATEGTNVAPPMLLCPNGHANAWNYKFCGQCGAPIGIVSWPDEDLDAEPAKPRQLRPVVIAIALTVALAAVAIVACVVYVASTPAGSQSVDNSESRATVQASTTTATRTSCSSAPVLAVDSFDLTTSGLKIGATFISPCGNQVVSNSALVVTAAVGQRDVAAAAFDFSVDPLALQANVPAHRTLVFPPGMYWRTPDMVSEAPKLIATLFGTDTVPQPSGSDEPLVVVASDSAKPQYGSVNGVAEAVLEELRVSDLTEIRRFLANSWVPQVSSKFVGLEWAGITWTSADILRDHLAFRYRFESARLVWSGDWTTFDGPIYWVTVVGPSYRFPVQANSWCDAGRFATDDCFAKFLSSSPVLAGHPGTTAYRR